MLSPLRLWLLAFLLPLGGHASVADRVDESGPSAPPLSDCVSWTLDRDGEPVEGTIAYVSENEGRLVLHLINYDAVNLLLVVPAEGPAERPVEEVFLTEGRGQTCSRVYSDPPFRVRFEADTGPWLRGSYAGTLGCEDYTPLPVHGTFQVEHPED